METYTLITGASSGIGLEIASQLAAQQKPLILVARSGDKLRTIAAELATKHQCPVQIIMADLANPDQFWNVFSTVKERGLEVSTLINNAGVGCYGDFDVINLQQQLDMLSLNIQALVALTHLFLPDMRERNAGHILNIGSLLSFFPFPYFSAYAASKAFVLSFSEALGAELSDTNIKVTVYCPGQTESAFASTKMLTTKAYKDMKMASASHVAAGAIKAMTAGRATVIHGFMNNFLVFITRFNPRAIHVKIMKGMASQI